jgi:purine-nucleoside phosphorylase
MASVRRGPRPDLYAQIQDAVRSIRRRTRPSPAVGIILGSGLGSLAERIEGPTAIPYSAISHFPAGAVAGHASRLVLGRLSGRPVAVMQGRVHYYEGFTMQEVTFPVRVLAALGIGTLIVTNAAGGLNPAFRTGDLMIIRDIINLMGANPLRGPNDERLGPRFPAMGALCSVDCLRAARAAARNEGIRLRTGVFAGVGGPSYETAAEVRMLWRLGADAVGMSTVPELIVARHAGIPRLLGISCITNAAAVGKTPARDAPTHDGVLAVAAKAEGVLRALLEGIVARL